MKASRSRWVIGSVAVTGCVLLALAPLRMGEGKSEQLPQELRSEISGANLDASIDKSSAFQGVSRDAVSSTHTQNVPEVVVFVVDHRDQGVEGCRLFLEDVEQARALLVGRTDEQGAAQITIPKTVASILRVQADGYSDANHHFPPAIAIQEEQQSVLIRIQPQSHLSGIVIDATGQPVGEGVCVLVWEPGWTVGGASLVRRALLGEPVAQSSTTDEHGRFHVSGLSPDRLYMLAAGGAGYATKSERPLELDDWRDCSVEVWPIYAALLERKHPGGESVRFPPNVITSYSHFDYVGLHGHAVPSRSVVAALAGWDYPPDNGSSCFPIVILSQIDADFIGPMHLTEHLPGYRKAMNTVYARRLRAPGASRIPVEYVPDTESWGEIRVRPIDRPTDAVVHQRRIGNWATLSLRKMSGVSEGNAIISIGLPDLDSEFSIPDVPAGSYYYDLRVSGAGAISDPISEGSEIVVRANVPAIIDFPLASLCSVEVVILRNDGTPYAGDFRLLLCGNSRQDTEASVLPASCAGTVWLKAPPYVLNLQPGSYSLKIINPPLENLIPRNTLLFDLGVEGEPSRKKVSVDTLW